MRWDPVWSGGKRGRGRNCSPRAFRRSLGIGSGVRLQEHRAAGAERRGAVWFIHWTRRRANCDSHGSRVFLRQNGQPELVRFVLFDGTALAAFDKAIKVAKQKIKLVLAAASVRQSCSCRYSSALRSCGSMVAGSCLGGHGGLGIRAEGVFFFRRLGLRRRAREIGTGELLGGAGFGGSLGRLNLSGDERFPGREVAFCGGRE